MISAATGGNVVTDDQLTLAKLMEFAGVLRDVEPDAIPSYQIEAVGKTISGNAVLEPRIDGENMQAVLAMFRGETSLADAPVQSFEPTTAGADRRRRRRRRRRPPRRRPRPRPATSAAAGDRPRGEQHRHRPARDVSE